MPDNFFPLPALMIFCEGEIQEDLYEKFSEESMLLTDYLSILADFSEPRKIEE